MELIKSRIDHKKLDHILIRYYPSCKKSNSVITVTQCNKMHDEIKTWKHMKKEQRKYIELGIKDTFMRINDDKSHSFFRREQYLFEYDLLIGSPEGAPLPAVNTMQGIFVIEIYNKCEEEEFPHIANYSHNISCDSTTYISNKICFTFSKIKDNYAFEKSQKPDQNLRVPYFAPVMEKQKLNQNPETEMFDINSWIDIKNFDKSLNDFFETIVNLDILKS